mgnify:CR=1 FL=1
MAVLDDVVLVADGGDVTVGRQTATFVYGEFNVVLPHGREKVETDDRLQDGYVYRPKGGIKGPFDVGFVRADATVDLEADTSDLEVVVDAAQKQVEGDVFFERDISAAGLGRFVLDRDFRVGDVVTVELWGKRLRLPVTAGDYVASLAEGVGGVRVHVGGQLISDAEAVARQNGDLRRQIAREKAERVRQVSSESSARRSAVDAERSARISGDQQLSDRIDRLPTSESLNSEIMGLNERIGGLNSDLTLLRQGEINELQRVINDRQTGINALNDRFQQEQLKVNALNDDFRAESIERDSQYAELLGKHSEALSKSKTALDNEEKYRLHMASGQASDGEVIPNGNPYFYIEHIGRGGSTGVWLTGVPCDGSITVMHRTNGGYTDMWALDVKRGQFTNSGSTVGGVGKFHYLWTGLGQKVVTWMVFYQLWPSDS